MYRIVKKELVDTISIPIMRLAKSVQLVHKVKLSRPDLDGNRDYFHKEFTYRSRYKDPKRVTTVRLTHSSILAIENKSDDSMESLIINMTNRDFIVKSLSKCKKILKIDDLFIEKDNGYIVNPKYRKETTISFSPYRDKIVVAKPCVITYDEEDPIDGIALSLDSKTLSFIEMPSEIFKVFLRIVKKFDFHTSGLAALAYLQSAEIGNHEIDIISTSIEEFDDLAPEYNIKDKKKTPGLKDLEVKKTGPLKNKGW